MFSGNTSKFGELSTTTDISKVRLVTIPNKDIKISPAPDFTTDNSHLVGVTSENKGVLIPPSELIPGIAFNSYDGDPKPMVSGEIWNEQEQLREAFTEGNAFILPHFRYVADDYFWKSIVGDKAFYYLTSMDLVTWPLVWTPSTTKPALHLEWLRAPEQTQIFKFTDTTPNSDWSAPSVYGNIILKNRTDAMVQVDPMEVRVNECSTSTNLKEVRVVVKSKDASPLYINFPGADVSITIPQTTAYNKSDNGIMRNIKITSNTSTDVDAKCEWNSLTINTSATKLTDCFNVEDTGKVCSGTVWVNASSATTLTNCFQNLTEDGTEGDFSADIRVALPNWDQSLTFGINMTGPTRGLAMNPAAVKYLFDNLNPNATNGGVITVGIDIRAFMGEFKTTIQEVEASGAALVSGGKWTIDYVPINHITGTAVFEPGNIDDIWERAKSGEFDGTNLNLTIGDVVLCFGKAPLPKTKVLPESTRFATNKTNLIRCFEGNTSIKNLEVYDTNKSITELTSFAANTKITTCKISIFRLSFGTSSDTGGLASCFSNCTNLTDAKIIEYNDTFIANSLFNNFGLNRVFLECPNLVSAEIISKATKRYICQPYYTFTNCPKLKHVKLTNIFNGAGVEIQAGWTSNKTFTNSPLTIESIKNVIKFFINGDPNTNYFNVYLSVGCTEAIANGNLTITPHLNPDGSESAYQKTLTYNNETYYANSDLWACCALVQTTDILELDGEQYTGKIFKSLVLYAVN